MGLGILIITGLDACLIGISIIELAYYVLKNLLFDADHNYRVWAWVLLRRCWSFYQGLL